MFKNTSSKYSHENVKSSIFIASVLKTKMVKNAFFCYMKQIWNSIFQYHRKKEVLIPIDLKYTLSLSNLFIQNNEYDSAS